MSDDELRAEEEDVLTEVRPSPSRGPLHGSTKLRITSVDLTPASLADVAKTKRMTRLDSNVSDFYTFVGNKNIGTGNFSVVKKVVNRSTGQEAAVKVIAKHLVKRKDRIIEEIRMLKDMAERPHIIQLFDVFESDDSLFLVMQLAEGGELFDRIVKRKRYNEADSKLLIKHLLEGVRDLHDRGIIHRDLKPENILMMKTESDTDIAISDFGLSKYFNPKKQALHKAMDTRQRNRAYTCCGTDIYMAPEVLSRGGYSYEADLWSVGVILYCVLAGYPPFYHERDDVVKKLIARGEYHFYPEEWDAVSEDAKAVVRALLVIEPERRATAERALAMPWFSI